MTCSVRFGQNSKPLLRSVTSKRTQLCHKTCFFCFFSKYARPTSMAPEYISLRPGPNVSTTPLRQCFQQCLPFIWTTLRGKHCGNPIAVMVVVDTFGPEGLEIIQSWFQGADLCFWNQSFIRNPKISSKQLIVVPTHTANIFNLIFTVSKCVPISTVISLYGLHLIAAPSTFE